jgi:hypothetical protein
MNFDPFEFRTGAGRDAVPIVGQAILNLTSPAGNSRIHLESAALMGHISAVT